LFLLTPKFLDTVVLQYCIDVQNLNQACFLTIEILWMMPVSEFRCSEHWPCSWNT
jgi:hypothetical protein